MRPVCVTCKQEMEPKTNDFRVLHKGAMWSGDLWTCSGCNHSIITGFGTKPLFDALEVTKWQADLVTQEPL